MTRFISNVKRGETSLFIYSKIQGFPRYTACLANLVSFLGGLGTIASVVFFFLNLGRTPTDNTILGTELILMEYY